MSPARHRGYALQWFTMAIALLGMFLYAGFKR
jgi:cytochrome oxidase assembly protein ShyY1